MLTSLSLAACLFAPLQEPLIAEFQELSNLLDFAGVALDRSGRRMLVGGLDDRAQVLRSLADGSWVPEAQLVEPAGFPFDDFGRAVALDGERALVGAPRHPQNGNESGSAFVFERTSAGWVARAELMPAGLAAGDRFGLAVDLDGERALVGARRAGGAAYVFRLEQGAWVEEQRLLASDLAPGDGFGRSVLLSDTHALVGSPRHDAGALDAGAVYRFERGAQGWSEAQKLLVSLPDVGDALGTSAALDIGADGRWTAVFGAPGAQAGRGAAYVFAGPPANLTQRARLSANAPLPNDRFAGSVAILGARIAVGAPGDDSAQSIDRGSVHLFERRPPLSDDWRHARRIVSSRAPQSSSGLEFGHAVALTPGGLVTGAPGQQVISVARVVDAPRGAYCAPLPGSTASSATIAVEGSTRIAANDAVLLAGPVPGQAGLFFYGDARDFVTFGNGVRCVGAGAAGIFRLPLETPTGQLLCHELDLSAPPAAAGTITSGSTWFFQAWYRDPAAGGQGFNASSAVELAFVP